MNRNHANSTRSLFTKYLFSFVLLCAICAVGVGLLIRKEQTRELGEARTTLAAAAEKGAGDIAQWLTTQSKELSTLADNASLQLYFNELQTTTDPAPSEIPEADYLRSLLTATAARMGLNDSANASGIALINNSGSVSVTSQNMPLTHSLIARVTQAPKAKEGVMMLDGDTPAKSQIALLSPVYGIQTDPSAESQVGYLIATTAAAPRIASILKQSAAKQNIRFSIEPAGTTAAASTDTLSEARSIAGAPWQITAHMSKADALTQAGRMQTGLIALTLLVLGAFGAVFYMSYRNARGHIRGQSRLSAMDKLVGVLISLVDAHDPNASQHSRRVAAMADKIATEMGLSPLMRETTENAARLMNVGKIVVPAELLAKKGVLAEAEIATIRNSMSASAELLQSVEFAGPVVQTLREAQEHVDGSGPLGLHGDNILISARIIAVANALVAMLSPRAHRRAMPLRDALTMLDNEAGTRYDDHAVSVLQKLHSEGALNDTLSQAA